VLPGPGAAAGEAAATTRAANESPIAAQIVAELNRLFAGESAHGADVRARAPSAAERVLVALGESQTSPVRTLVAGATAEGQMASARRLEASLLRSLEPALQAAAWRVVTPAKTAVTGPREDGLPKAELPGPAAAAILDGPSPWFNPGLATGASAGSAAEATSARSASSNVPTADAQNVVPQIVKAIRLQWKQGVSEARIRLAPEHLGEVQVSLRVQAGAVTAVIRAENPTVQGWIEVRQQELKSALSEQGLRLQRFEVVVDPEGRRQWRDAEQEGQQRRSRRNGPANTEFVVEP
jgi:flagellar hook-length control protein FliK